MKSEFVSQLWAAFEALYLATNDDDETDLFRDIEPGNPMDQALAAYCSTWDALVAATSDKNAKSMFDAFMRRLPRAQRSDCYPDGSC